METLDFRSYLEQQVGGKIRGIIPNSYYPKDSNIQRIDILIDQNDDIVLEILEVRINDKYEIDEAHLLGTDQLIENQEEEQRIGGRLKMRRDSRPLVMLGKEGVRSGGGGWGGRPSDEVIRKNCQEACREYYDDYTRWCLCYTGCLLFYGVDE